MGYSLDFKWDNVTAPNLGDSVTALNSAAGIFDNSATKYNDIASKIRDYQQEQASSQLLRDAMASYDPYDVNSLNKFLATHAGNTAYANAGSDLLKYLSGDYRIGINNQLAKENLELGKRAMAKYQALADSAYDFDTAVATSTAGNDYMLNKLDPRLLQQGIFKPANTAGLRKNDADIANINSSIRSRGIADAGQALRNKRAQLDFDKDFQAYQDELFKKNTAMAFLQKIGWQPGMPQANADNLAKALANSNLSPRQRQLVLDTANELQKANNPMGYGGQTAMGSSISVDPAKALVKTAYSNSPEPKSTSTTSDAGISQVNNNVPASNNATSTQDNLKNAVNGLLPSVKQSNSNTALTGDQLLQQKARELAREAVKDDRAEAHKGLLDAVQSSFDKAQERFNRVNELKNNNRLLTQSPTESTRQLIEASREASKNPWQVPEVTIPRALWDMQLRNNASAIPGENEARRQLLEESRANWNQRQKDAKTRSINLEDRKRLDNISEALHYFDKLQNSPELQDKSKYALTEEYLAKDYPEYADRNAFFNNLDKQYQQAYNESLDILKNSKGIFKSEPSNNANSGLGLTPESQIYDSIPEQIPVNSYEDNQLMRQNPSRYNSKEQAINSKREVKALDDELAKLKKQYDYTEQALKNLDAGALGLGSISITPSNQKEVLRPILRDQEILQENIKALENQRKAKVNTAINAWANYSGVGLPSSKEDLVKSAYPQSNNTGVPGSTNSIPQNTTTANTQQNATVNNQNTTVPSNTRTPIDIVKNEATIPENRPEQYDSTIKEETLDTIEANLSTRYTPTLNAPVVSSDRKMSFPIQSLVKMKKTPESILNIKAEDVHNAHAVAKAVTNISQYAGKVEQTDINKLTNGLQEMFQEYSGSLDNIAQLGAIFVQSVDSADALDYVFDHGSFEGTAFEEDFIKPYLDCFRQLKDPSSTGYTTYKNFADAKKDLAEFAKIKNNILQAVQNSDNVAGLIYVDQGTIRENNPKKYHSRDLEAEASLKWEKLLKFLEGKKLFNN